MPGLWVINDVLRFGKSKELGVSDAVEHDRNAKVVI